MYRLKLLLVGVSAALAATVGTAYASSIVRDALTERYKASRIEVPNQFDEGHVIKMGAVLLLQADGVPAGVLRTTQINTKSPRFHAHDYARVTVGEDGHIILAEPASLTLGKGTRLVVLNLKVDRDRVRMFTHTLDPVRVPDGKTAHGCTEFIFVFDPATLAGADVATVSARIDQWLSVASAG